MGQRAVAREILRAAAGGCILHALALSGAACRLPAPEARPPLTLVEKGSTQSIYDAEGRLQRVLIDADGDRLADAQFLYGPEGTPRVAEIDTDRDGVVDRWEHFAADGEDELVVEELDTDGDGRPDRRLRRRRDGAIVALEIDRDQDGIWERLAPVQPR